MGPKSFTWTMMLLLCCLTTASTQAPSEVTTLRNSSMVRDERLIKGRPIVIHTQQQHYEKPTLNNYQECSEDHEKCIKACATAAEWEACEKQCPICPILIDENIYVQGINDTRIHRPVAAPVNTTNVIRLTNKIHNTFDNSQGNITHNSNNLVNIHPNVSSIDGQLVKDMNVRSNGGQFAKDVNVLSSDGQLARAKNSSTPCCTVLRPSRNCDSREFATLGRCQRKRHRVCGDQCTASVMLAKIVTVCENNLVGTSLETADENFSENCHETIKYVPYQKAKRTSSKCHYTPNWPYIKCPQKRVSSRGGRTNVLCMKCRQMPYLQVLRFGIPQQCRRCSGMGMGMGMGMGTGMGMEYPTWPAYGTPMMNNGFDDYPLDNSFGYMEPVNDGWYQQPDYDFPEVAVDSVPEAQDYEYEGDDNADDYAFGPLIRQRRNIKGKLERHWNK